MCRLFGLHAGREPVRASFWLLDAPDALVEQSRRNPDGFGIGTFEPDGSPDLDKAPAPAYTDALYAVEAREERSRTFVAHVRYATAGGLTYENTHPFEQDGRLFAHNGVVNFDPADPVDPSLVHGQTDSERLFARITLAIRAHGGDVRAGIAEATRRMAADVELHSLNFVLTTPDELWALRYPEHNELLVIEHPREPPLDQSGDRGIRVRSDDAAGRRVVVIASERMDDQDGWDPLAPGELVHVDSDLRVTREVILPDPPARPMTLTPREAVSQAQERA